jgi:DNA-3-methyladenine glycosylase
MNSVNEGSVLTTSFYLQDTREVARQLLGKRLIRRTAGGEIISGEIVETEAYLFDDPASHSYRGPSIRNKSMYGVPGRTYIHLSYGIHDMLNIVTRPDGVGEAVLVRAVLPLEGIDLIRQNVGKPDAPIQRLASGPGLVAKAFGISRFADSDVDLTNPESGIWIENYLEISSASVVVTVRIGITKAADKPWRYYIWNNPAVSKTAQNKTPSIDQMEGATALERS